MVNELYNVLLEDPANFKQPRKFLLMSCSWHLRHLCATHGRISLAQSSLLMSSGAIQLDLIPHYSRDFEDFFRSSLVILVHRIAAPSLQRFGFWQSSWMPLATMATEGALTVAFVRNNSVNEDLCEYISLLIVLLKI